jgi:hypothetical protein
MRKVVCASLVMQLTLMLAVAGFIFIDVGDANPVGILQGLPSITIESDGSVNPQTEYIYQNGNIYYLTKNLSQNYRLVINCSNIVFDGQGNIINGSKRFLWRNDWVDSYCIGITLDNVKNVTVRDVIVIGFYESSIKITKCSSVTILRVQTDAKPSVDPFGSIWLEESCDNTISNCNTGIRLISGSNNHFIRNTVYLNIDSSLNFFYQNNINVYYYHDWKNNIHRGKIIGGGSSNTWDNGIEGNYWSDYNGADVNNDGIGDTLYTIDEQEVDRYPLIKPINETYYLLKTSSPKILLCSPLNQTNKELNVPVCFSMDKIVNSIYYSLDGQENTTINGNTTLTNLASGLHNLTIYATDTHGNRGASETIYFTVVAPFPTLLVVAPLALVIVGVGSLLLYRRHRTKTNFQAASP